MHAGNYKVRLQFRDERIYKGGHIWMRINWSVLILWEFTLLRE